ncbi:MAG TPA: hypothetical protein VIG64_01755 [Actinomycetota bacterium]|jgi:hypothetical protein
MAPPVVDVPVVTMGTARGLLTIAATLLPGMLAWGVRREIRKEVSIAPVTMLVVIAIYSALAILIGETLAELWGSLEHGLIHGDVGELPTVTLLMPGQPVLPILRPGAGASFGDFIWNEMRGPYYEGPALSAWPRVGLLMAIAGVLPLLEPGARAGKRGE